MKNIDEVRMVYPEIPRENARDYSKERIGMLTPLYRTNDVKNSIVWVVRCDCGVHFPLRASNLRVGRQQACRSCAWLDKTFRQEGVPAEVVEKYPEIELRAARDRHGEKYGSLTALYRTKPTRDTYWLCSCSCGRYDSFRAGELQQGRETHCRLHFAPK